MDYAMALQSIIDDLRADKQTDPKWRNKILARLEELQPWCLMLYDAPDFSDDKNPSLTIYDEASTVSSADIAKVKPVTIDQIPASLREFADPNKLQQPTV